MLSVLLTVVSSNYKMTIILYHRVISIDKTGIQSAYLLPDTLHLIDGCHSFSSPLFVIQQIIIECLLTAGCWVPDKQH